VGDAMSLWLERDPTLAEIAASFEAQDLTDMDEIVFCGYGEPLTRVSEIPAIIDIIRKTSPLPLRLNTNGLYALDGTTLSAFDTISVSLNADDADEYVRLVQPDSGIKAYAIMLDFIKKAKQHTTVIATVVDCLAQERIENCRTIAEELGVQFRVRTLQ